MRHTRCVRPRFAPALQAHGFAYPLGEDTSSVANPILRSATRRRQHVIAGRDATSKRASDVSLRHARSQRWSHRRRSARQPGAPGAPTFVVTLPAADSRLWSASLPAVSAIPARRSMRRAAAFRARSASLGCLAMRAPTRACASTERLAAQSVAPRQPRPVSRRCALPLQASAGLHGRSSEGVSVGDVDPVRSCELRFQSHRVVRAK